MSCEAVIDFGSQEAISCSEETYYRVVYVKGCEHWPDSREFCISHGMQVVEQWAPPYDRGACPECLCPLAFQSLEVKR